MVKGLIRTVDLGIAKWHLCGHCVSLEKIVVKGRECASLTSQTKSVLPYCTDSASSRNADGGKVLVHVLDQFQTQPLLQYRAVSHRFQNLIIRIIHGRLLRAASLRNRKLILECYHPSAQYTEPYLYCDYLGTPGLSDNVEGQGTIYEIADDPASERTLQKLYSHFRPTRKDLESSLVRSHPAGDVPGSRTSEAAESRRQTREAEAVRQTVSLEAHELFSQLCFSVGLVQVGPRRGVFLSNVDAVEKKTFRIWRHWLAEMAKCAEEEAVNTSFASESQPIEGSENKNGSPDQLIWVDQNKVAGLKVWVTERKWQRDTPILILKDEDHAVSYSLELKGRRSTFHT